MTAAEEVNKMDIVLIGNNNPFFLHIMDINYDIVRKGEKISFLLHHKWAFSAPSNPNVELQRTLPVEAVDRHSGSTWNQLLRFWTEVTRTRNQVV